MITPKETLVKYNSPVPTRTVSDADSDAKPKFGRLESFHPDILTEIFPPIKWEKDGKLWCQKVSDTPSNTYEVLHLASQLDQRLRESQAKTTGVCPVRRELYKQAFDETIRQVAIHCPERGRFLMRIRDEMNITLESYKTVDESLKS